VFGGSGCRGGCDVVLQRWRLSVMPPDKGYCVWEGFLDLIIKL